MAVRVKASDLKIGMQHLHGHGVLEEQRVDPDSGQIWLAWSNGRYGWENPGSIFTIFGVAH